MPREKLEAYMLVVALIYDNEADETTVSSVAVVFDYQLVCGPVPHRTGPYPRSDLDLSGSGQKPVRASYRIAWEVMDRMPPGYTILTDGITFIVRDPNGVYFSRVFTFADEAIDFANDDFAARFGGFRR